MNFTIDGGGWTPLCSYRLSMKQFKTLIEVFQYAAATENTETEPEEIFEHNVNVAQLVKNTLHRHTNQTVFYSKDKDKNYQAYPFDRIYTRSENAALGLMSLGVKPGAKVGLISDNRLEWMIADIAVLLGGAVDVPRGADSTPDEIAYILAHADCKIAFLENRALLKKVAPILKDTPVEEIILLEEDQNVDVDSSETLTGNIRPRSLTDLIHLGESMRNDLLEELHIRSRAVNEYDPYTIIYTSGTTGKPKGVVLTHRNMCYNINNVPAMLGVEFGERCLSILPVWHIFERALEYCLLPYQCKLYYTNVRDLREDFLKARPTFMASAPRLWENIYGGLLAKMDKGDPRKKALFEAALKVNKRVHRSLNYLQGNELKTRRDDELTRLPASLMDLNLYLPARLLDRLVFSKIRDALGGELKGTISGGGALPPHVDEFFNLIGIPVYEGYGMTECSPIISVRTRGHVVQGSVGFAPAGTEIRVLNEKEKECKKGELGVIHVKGPQVMSGYYKNTEATDRVLKDGWLNTGDLGFISYNNTLSIRGRAKDTIVLLGGENIEPEPIENLLKQSEYVAQIMVTGQDRKTLGALIWPETANLSKAGLIIEEGRDLNQNVALRKHFQNLIKAAVNSKSGFKSFERITDFRFLPRQLEVGDELTGLHKMKRNVISQKYAALIDEIHG